MADPNARTASDSEAQANAGRQQATNPEQRSFEGDMEGAGSADRPAQADLGEAPDRNGAGMDDVPGDLGAGTPANVDIHKLGQKDRPEEEWGEPAGEGAMHGSNHTRRPDKTEALRGQGLKTRKATKDQISRRT